MNHDWQRLTLQTWAAWVADGRPLLFSLYGDSTAARVYQARHKRTYLSDSPLWREGPTDALHKLDGRLHGALSASERRILLAACVPLGRPCPASERASAAGVSVDQLRATRRKAMALID